MLAIKLIDSNIQLGDYSHLTFFSKSVDFKCSHYTHETGKYMR